MVGDMFLIWDGLGVAGGGWRVVVVGNCRKNSCTKKKRQQIQCKAIERNREQINGRNCVVQKNCPTPEIKSILFLEK